MSGISEPRQDWTEQANALWQFTLQYFNQPLIQNHCLALRESYGFDVNLLLLCGWLANHYQIALTDTQLQALLDNTLQWRQRQLQTLRKVRQCTRPGADEHPSRHRAYEALKHAEELMERHCQYLFLQHMPAQLVAIEGQQVSVHAVCAESFRAYDSLLASANPEELQELAQWLSNPISGAENDHSMAVG